MEERVLDRWRERAVFAQSMHRRRGAPQWVFYEGPPTANGPPGSHHVLARVFKDIFPRYKTMRGFYVERKGGWDCHGLPVELAVEKELGMSSKEDIERYGIAEFNARCREIVLSHVEDWSRLTERIGHWIDTDDAYRTLDPGYVESVWWALQTIHGKGLLYEKLKVVPYCPRCGTALSSHELGQPGRLSQPGQRLRRVRLHRADRAAHRRRGLRFGLIAEITEHDHGPLPGRQPVQRAEQCLPGVDLRERVPVGPQLGQPGGGDLTGPAPLPPAQERVDHDLAHVKFGCVLPGQGGPSGPGRREGGLHEVLGAGPVSG